MTLQSLAACNRHLESIQLLYSPTTFFDDYFRVGKSPHLHQACLNGYTKIVPWLLAHYCAKGSYAQVRLSDENEDTPLMLAAVEEHDETAQPLLKAMQISLQAAVQAPRLIQGLSMDLTTTAELLPKEEVSPNIREEDTAELTLLILAVKRAALSLVHLVPEKDADINIQDEESLTALHHAAVTGDENVLAALFCKKPDVHIQDGRENKRTALPHATLHREQNMAGIALKIVAKNNVSDVKSQSASSLAAEKGYKSMLQLRLGRGADTTSTKPKTQYARQQCLVEQRYSQHCQRKALISMREIRISEDYCIMQFQGNRIRQ
ncbi:hypothetical protein EYC84_011285 [Monilinia fructicola]|uniref:Uncharacterized protein n=1 Tax=Monilinia fructicola TaxID=38448 RepID=A0A5M9J5N4_MONFR|nr:hypothetical protein EYC84_011285 [Monilinia fructicola]